MGLLIFFVFFYWHDVDIVDGFVARKRHDGLNVKKISGGGFWCGGGLFI